ncbi:unnamed protein product [Schistosoma curassoni]|uniref:Uncharacterized protein n=1 Tax=Schistosoma curassoni TaxID=6186 RepID=A0A183JW31_9TREM|nr:unnamed protein product [Schistosoma curassoni]
MIIIIIIITMVLFNKNKSHLIHLRFISVMINEL